MLLEQHKVNLLFGKVANRLPFISSHQQSSYVKPRKGLSGDGKLSLSKSDLDFINSEVNFVRNKFSFSLN